MAKRLSDSIVTTNGNGAQRAPGAPSGPQLSHADDFPAPLDESFFVELSTGRVVEMVVGELSMFYELGRIPDELKSIAARILFTTAKDDPKAIEKRYFERLELARWTVGEVLRNNTTPLERFYHAEIWDIYNFANDPALAMENFRLFQAKHVGVVPEGGDIWTVAEPVAEDSE